MNFPTCNEEKGLKSTKFLPHERHVQISHCNASKMTHFYPPVIFTKTAAMYYQKYRAVVKCVNLLGMQ